MRRSVSLGCQLQRGLELSEKNWSRSASEEIAEHFEKLIITLEALATRQDDARDGARIKRVIAAARRGTELARQLDGGEASDSLIARRG